MRKLKLFFACLLMAVLSIGQMWGAADLTITADFSSSNVFSMNTSGNDAESRTDMSDGTYTYYFYASNSCYYTTNKLFIGKSNSYVEFPAISGKKLTKVTITPNSGTGGASLTICHKDSTVATPGGASQSLSNGSTTPKEWTLTHTTANTAYKVLLGGGKNAHITSWSLEYTNVGGGGSTKPTVSVDPDGGNFIESVEVTVNPSTGATAYYTTDATKKTSPSTTTWTAYNGSAKPTFTETTTVWVAAVKDAAWSDVVEKTFTKIIPITSYDIDFETTDFDLYVNWDFVNAEVATNGDNTNINAHGGTHYGTTGGKTTAAIQTHSPIAAPGTLSCYVSKQSDNTNSSTWYIQVSENGTDWTDVESRSATSMTKGNWVEFSADLSAYTDVYVRLYYSGGTAIRNVDDISLEMASAVKKPVISGNEDFFTSTEVSIACETTGATIYYTIDGTDPKTSDTKLTYSDPFSLTETKTVRAIAELSGDWSAEATSKTFTKITPITVAAAIAAIPNKDDVVNDQYVSGIVCTAGTSVSSGKMTYYISDDGSETNRLQIYKGKNVGNTNFTAATDLAIGDRVTVFGQLKNFNNTPEMNDGNYLVSKEDPAVATPVFSPNGGGFMGETDVTITCGTTGSAIYYTLNGTTPSKSSTLYEGAIHLTETKTITAIAYVGDEHSIVVAKTFTYTAPMSVDDAFDALDSEDPLNNTAVSGIVCQVDACTGGTYATYWISDDGTTTAEKKLEIYRGYGLNGANFAAGGIQVGDEVTVFGNLTIYKQNEVEVCREFAAGSRLLAFNRPAVALTGVTLPATASVKVGSTITLTPTFDPVNATNQNVTWSVKSGSDYASVNQDGVVSGIAAGEAIIKVTTEEGGLIAECTVTVSEAVTFNNSGYEWQLVTSESQLVAGKYYVLGSTASDKVAGGISNDIMGTIAATCADGVIAYNAFGTSQTADVANVVVFELGGNSSAWTLNEVVNDLGLLGYKGNKTVKWGGEATTWTIAIADNNATMVPVAANTYHMMYNVQNPRFTVYTSDPNASMLLPQLYVWAEKVYKLRYDANGGEDAPDAQPAVNGEATVTNDQPTKEDKIFNGWNTTATGDGANKAAGDIIDLSSADVTLFAQWRDPESVTISYDANGGDGSIEADENQVEGTSYTIKSNEFTREGYNFAGWKAYNAAEEELEITNGQFTVPATNVTVKAQWAVLTVSDFVLVTDINQLKDGDKVYVVAAGYDKAMGTQNGTTYRNEVAIAKDNNHILLAGTAPVEFTLGKDGNKYTFSDETGYLYAAGTANSSKNYLDTKADHDAACDWNITIDENGTVIKSVANGYTPYMQFNNGSHRFACYHEATMQAIVLYKKLETIREDGVAPGVWGTICPKKEIAKAEGASFFQISYVEYHSGVPYKVFYDEIAEGENLVAGQPYLFLADENATAIKGFKVGNDATSATNDHGFIGVLENKTISVAQADVDAYKYYIVYNNEIRLCGVGQFLIKAERAYLDMSDPNVEKQYKAPIAGRRRVALTNNAAQNATGCENINASETPVKMIIDGQLYILRGEKMYDATGKLVK